MIKGAVEIGGVLMTARVFPKLGLVTASPFCAGDSLQSPSGRRTRGGQSRFEAFLADTTKRNSNHDRVFHYFIKTI